LRGAPIENDLRWFVVGWIVFRSNLFLFPDSIGRSPVACILPKNHYETVGFDPTRAPAARSAMLAADIPEA
jgi:hypothetical protein